MHFYIITAQLRKLRSVVTVLGDSSVFQCLEREGLPARVTHVLFGCESWSVTLTEENKLRVFENEVLRKISAAKRDGVTAEWRRRRSGDLHGVYCSPVIARVIKSSRRMRWAGQLARMERGVPTAFWWGSLRKRPLGRPRVDGIVMLKSIFKK